MRLYTRQLACLLLLFSALGAAGAAVAPVGVTRTQIHALLARGAETTTGSPAPLTQEPQNAGHPTATALPCGPQNIFSIVPASYPPASQAASTHTLTSLLRA